MGILLAPLPLGLGGDPLMIAGHFTDNSVKIYVVVLLARMASVVFLWFLGHLRPLL